MTDDNKDITGAPDYIEKAPELVEKVTDEQSNLYKCAGGTINYIQDVKIKMMSISMKEEDGSDETKQEKKASIFIKGQGVIKLEEGSIVDLTDDAELVVNEILPYTMSSSGHVLFELREKEDK